MTEIPEAAAQRVPAGLGPQLQASEKHSGSCGRATTLAAPPAYSLAPSFGRGDCQLLPSQGMLWCWVQTPGGLRVGDSSDRCVEGGV